MKELPSLLFAQNAMFSIRCQTVLCENVVEDPKGTKKGHNNFLVPLVNDLKVYTL